MAESPATLLVVSHDRRLLETVCEKLWVVDEGSAVPFDGGYREWRAAVAGGWTVEGALEAEAKRLRGGRAATPRSPASAPDGAAPDGRYGRAPAVATASAGARPFPPHHRRPRSGEEGEAVEGCVSAAAGCGRC